MKNKIYFASLILISISGTFAGLQLSIEHLKHGEICPMIGPIPACIIVFIGYFLALVSTVIYKKKYALKLFYIGWTPVFLLAISGVILELTRGQICPPGPAGIPKCFISLAMAILAAVLFTLIRKARASA